MADVTVNDLGKMILMVVLAVGGIVLAALGRDIGGYVIVGVLGYAGGNGVNALRKNPPSTMLAPVLPKDQYVHRDDLLALTEARQRVGAKVTKARAGAQGEPRAGAS